MSDPSAGRPSDPGGDGPDPRALQELIGRVWTRVLGVPEVGPGDAFEDLGGDSIALVQVLHELRGLARLRDVDAWVRLPTTGEQAAFLVAQQPETARRLLRAGRPSAAPDDAPDRLAHFVQREDVDGLAVSLHAHPAYRDFEGPGPDRAKNPPAAFVLTSPRSGSTLLRVMLAGHSRLFCPPELNLLQYRDLEERWQGIEGRHFFPERARSGLGDALMVAGGLTAAEAKAQLEAWQRERLPDWEIFRELQAMVRPRLLVDKSPGTSGSLRVLARAEAWFHKPRFLHLVRSPAAAIESAEVIRMRTGYRRPGTPPYYSAECFWNLEQENIETFLASIPRFRWHRVRYEDLVRWPEATMREVAAFLGIDYEEALVTPYDDAERMTDARFLVEEPEPTRPPEMDARALATTAAGDFKVKAVHTTIDPAMAARSLRLGLDLSAYTWRNAARYGYGPGYVAPRELAGVGEATTHPRLRRRSAGGAGSSGEAEAPATPPRDARADPPAEEGLVVPGPPALDSGVLQQQRDYTASWTGERLHPDSLVFAYARSGRRLPLFWWFQNDQEPASLSRCLGEDQPLYAMRSGYKVLEYTPEKVASLAATYLEDLEAVHPEGPFLIGGNCQGARVAWEAAEQLRRRGREIALTALLERAIRRPCTEPVALFFGEDSEFNPSLYHDSPEVGMSRYYTGRLTVDPIPCGHGQFFFSPNVEVLADRLRMRIDAALAARDGVAVGVDVARAELVAPATMKLGVGEEVCLDVRVRNPTAAALPAGSRSGLCLANVWMDPRREVLRWRDGRTPLPQDLEPGAEVSLELRVRAPEAPGRYLLGLDLLIDGMTRSRPKRAGACEVEVEVERQGRGWGWPW